MTPYLMYLDDVAVGEGLVRLVVFRVLEENLQPYNSSHHYASFVLSEPWFRVEIMIQQKTIVKKDAPKNLQWNVF